MRAPASAPHPGIVGARAADTPGGGLELVLRTCDALRDEAVRCCHFKSTEALDRSANGENDLDLLVHADDTERFLEVLVGLGFREAVVSPSRRIEGIRHLYGLDERSGKLVDVHAHDRLVVGDDATKNYHVPIEQAFLSSTATAGPFEIPRPEIELVLLVIRMMLKHGTPEALLTGRGALRPGERRELAYLETSLGRDALAPALRECGFLDAELFERCRRSLDPGASVRSRLRAWRALAPRLAPYARRGRAADVWLQGSRRVAGRVRRHVLRAPPRKRLASGGAVVAVIGSDGAGKSTAIQGAREWLGPVFRVRTLHLGKPRRSAAWIALRVVGRLTRGSGRRRSRPRGAGAVDALTAVALARARRRATDRAHRLAARGAIVLCDRYPVPELATDGPRLMSATEPGPGLIRACRSIESRRYAGIRRPDVTVVLRVDPAVAAARRPGDHAEKIRARAREVLDAPWPPATVRIDACLPADEVLATLKAELWKRL